MSDLSHAIALPEDCTLDWAFHLQEEALPLRDGITTPRFEVSAVCRITTPVLQLMLAILKWSAERGQRGEVAGASVLFDSAVAELGLTPLFEQWSTRIHG